MIPFYMCSVFSTILMYVLIDNCSTLAVRFIRADHPRMDDLYMINFIVMSRYFAISKFILLVLETTSICYLIS